MPTTLLIPPYIFRPSYGPFELLLAWFVDVAIQFVMLSQYGRGWSVIMHMYYSSNSPLRYLHLGNLFTVFQWVSVCVQCFQPLPRIEWLRDYRTGLELARVPRVPGTTEFLDRAWVSTGAKGAWHHWIFGHPRILAILLHNIMYHPTVWGFTSDWHPLFQINLDKLLIKPSDCLYLFDLSSS